MLWDVIVIGAGVLGTFHAYFACRHGLRTLLIERGEWPGEASARNFGMIIPSGMAPGAWHRRGLESAALYRRLAGEVPVRLHTGGTQYLATTPGEAVVLEEFARLGPGQGYRCELLDGQRSTALNPAIDPRHCLASLHFPDDLRLEPRALFRALIPWLVREQGCTYLPRTAVVGVTVHGEECHVTTADGQHHRARHVFVCNGSDLRTLFPERLAHADLIHCKLQLMRTEAQGATRLPTSLASGLSLRRYASFRLCPSWPRLEEEPADPEVLRRGIHVLLVQDEDGRVVVGDSHEYTAENPDDVLDNKTEALILAEAQQLVRLEHWRIAERWHGVYTLHPQRELYTETVAGRIHLVTGVGGKGMTTGPALAREAIGQLDLVEDSTRAG